MTIGILTAAYPSPSSPVRAVFIEGVTRAMARAARVAVVAPRIRTGDPLRERRHGIPVRRFAYPGGCRLKERATPAVLAVYLASALGRVLSAFRTFEARALLGHWLLPSGFVARIAGARLGIPVVLYAHGSDVTYYARRGSASRAAARFAIAGAARVACTSAEIAGILEREFGRRPDAVLPVGVDPQVFRPQAGAARIPDGGILLYVGDLIPEKGIREILRAREMLGRRGTWVFLGDGPLRREIARAAGGGVILAGSVPPAEVARWLRRADALLLPSHREGTPASVLEALACGTPVIATRAGGIPEWVRDGESGLLVEPRDSEALARAIGALQDSPDLAARLRAGARSATPPSFEETAGRLLALIEDCAR
ncbi:MAG: glycosyltransferase [Planctomycetes bacterium]|nr:glycosyltransferase [Planctomycetota bacterium]